MQVAYGQKVSAFEISACEVCGNTALNSVLNLGRHPLCDDLLPVGSTLRCVEYPIEIIFCDVCRTAHQRLQIEKGILFPASYHYRARFTEDVLKGMEQLTLSCRERFGDFAGKKILDVGCNDGSLLNFFRQKGAITIGVEPTDAAKDALANGHNILNSFWDLGAAQQIRDKYQTVDLITFTNVFAHISNLAQVLKALKVVAGPRTILVIENHYLGSVLNNSQFDTFYHEHPRTYSSTSFEWIAKSLGMRVVDAEFPARYGGNIRVFLSLDVPVTMSQAQRSEREVYEAKFREKLIQLNETAQRWRIAKRRSIEELFSKHGKLAAKAFPGRAAILVKLLGLDERMINAVYERRGSMKIGHYVPGTHIPICSDDVLFEKEDIDRPILNLAWHIRDEIHGYMNLRGYRGKIIEIFSPDEKDW